MKLMKEFLSGIFIFSSCLYAAEMDQEKIHAFIKRFEEIVLESYRCIKMIDEINNLIESSDSKEETKNLSYQCYEIA